MTESPCTRCQKRSQWQEQTTTYYCSKECHALKYTPQAITALTPIRVPANKEAATISQAYGANPPSFLDEEHTIPYVVAFDMDQVVDETSEKRRQIYTDENMQLVVEVVPAGGVIAREIHPTQTQFIRIHRGSARVDIYYAENRSVLFRSFTLSATALSDSIIIHAGVYHKVTNVSPTEEMKFYTIYAPHVH